MGALLSLALIVATQVVSARTVHSLDQVPSVLKTPEGKRVFAEQMEGKPSSEQLGQPLPRALSAPTINALLVPSGSTDKPNAVGAMPLPGESDIYVAIACTGGDLPTQTDDPKCSQNRYGDPRPALHVYLGMIEAKANVPLRLIAGPLSFDGAVDWDDSGLPSAPEPVDAATGRDPAFTDATATMIRPDKIDGFDPAPYGISPGQRAFGLRGSWVDGYSGGMSSYGALYLFAVVNGSLKRILAVPMSAYRDIAGDWHKNGTRDHDVGEGANVLIVTAQTTNGHFDLLLKSRNRPWRRLYRWSDISGNYRPASR